MTIRSIDLPHDLAAVAALEDHYRTGYVHPPHAHDRAQLSFALSGVLTVNTAETSFVLPPNRAIWIPPYKLHQTICRSEAVFQLLYVDPRFIRQSRDCCVFETSPLVRALIGEIANFDDHYEMDGREAKIVQLLLDEIERMPIVPLRAELPSDRRLRRVCEAILANPADTSDIDYWAGQAAMARRTFTRRFREQTGMGFATWRRRVRVMEAASRIGAGEPITSVAYDVGYDSPSAFTAMFHRTVGATPSTCRRC